MPHSIEDYPQWAHWFAMDADGACWVFEHEPNQSEKGWYENELGRYQKVQMHPRHLNWQDSLKPLF